MIDLKQKLIEALEKLYCYVDVHITDLQNSAKSIDISQMYEYVECQKAEDLLKQSYPNHTVVEVDRDSECGCETCDYGSRYTITFLVSPTEEEGNDANS